MKRNVVVIAAVAALAVPALSQAIPIRPGPYVSGFVGVSGVSSTDASTFDFAANNSFNERVKFDPSINIGGTGGFDFGMVRLEGELSYKRGEISSVTSTPAAGGTPIQFGNIDGGLGALAFMANAFIDLHNQSPITPYIGGGIGFATLFLDDTTSGPSVVYFRDDDTVFAYQVGGGLEIALNRHLSLDLGYRYFATSRAHFNNTPIITDMKFESHNGAVGFRVKF